MPDNARFSNDSAESAKNNADVSGTTTGSSDAGISSIQGPKANNDLATIHPIGKTPETLPNPETEPVTIKNPEGAPLAPPEEWRPGGPEG